MILKTIFNRWNWKLLLLLAVLLSTPMAQAGMDPISTAADHRIKVIPYQPNQVVQLLSHFGYTIHIEYAKGEVVDTGASGKPKHWHVSPLGNAIVLEPILEDNTTNLTIVTNKRIYHYELQSRKTRNPRDKLLTYALSYIYPGEHHAKTEAKQRRLLQKLKAQEKINKEKGLRATDLNFNYSFAGDTEIAPIQAFDDGTFTFFKFPQNQPLPAVFAVDKQRNESLVNFRMDGDYVVVERLSGRFTMRHGNLQTSVIRMDKQPSVRRPARTQQKTVSNKSDHWSEQWAGW